MLHKTDLKHRCKHAACIVYKGKIIATAVNIGKSHPLQRKYGRDKNEKRVAIYKRKAIYLHAELHALIKAASILNKKKFKKASLYIIRSGFQNSKPCEGCQRAIKAFGINRVFHS